jgi:dTDP-4-amino-4,6-dideoxygalactose transaminase
VSPIPFVADKDVNWQRVQVLLSESKACNRWSNFGPVSRRLEAKIHETLDLTRDLAVVVCSSGTSALQALVAMEDNRAGRRLKWCVSAYGFYCSVQENLLQARVIDCDDQAMFPLAEIPGVEAEALVVTNVFGSLGSTEPYRVAARKRGIPMVVDAAKDFHAGARGPNEMISFHHTKPWGFGEGGCAIVQADDEEAFRRLISFGVSPEAIDPRGLNGKMSDVAAAFILSRLEEMEALSPRYRAQYQRILQLGLSEGYQVLGGVMSHPGVPASVPFVAPHPVDLKPNEHLTLGKYYRPVGPGQTARKIFASIINVPCHPGVEVLPDRTISQVLAELING